MNKAPTIAVAVLVFSRLALADSTPADLPPPMPEETGVGTLPAEPAPMKSTSVSPKDTSSIPGAVVAPSAGKNGGSTDLGKPGSVEIQVRRLADKLAAGMASREGGGRYERWAVTPFSELGEDVQKRRLGEVVAAQLETNLKADHGFITVERMKLVEVIKEAQLAQAGVIEDRNTVKLGELSGADILIVGSVGMLGDRYVVNARAVSASDAKVIAAGQVAIDAAGLIALSSDAVVLRTKSDAIFRSVLIPGWGQFYNRQEQKGGLLMFAAGSLLLGGLTFYGLGSSTAAAYTTLDPVNNPGPCEGKTGQLFSSCVADQRTIANGRFSTANALFVGLAAVYLYNVLDAYLFGYDATSAVATTGFGVGPGGLVARTEF